MGDRLHLESVPSAPPSTGNRRLYAGPGVEIGTWSGVSKVSKQAFGHPLAVLGMQTDFQFAKIIREFFVLIPKLAFASRRKVNCTGDQITVEEARIGRLDRRILVRVVYRDAFHTGTRWHIECLPTPNLGAGQPCLETG